MASAQQPAAPASGIDAPAPKPALSPEEDTHHHRVWRLRAALNIAALQCQHDVTYATVANYNDFLKRHAVELERVRALLTQHFRRIDKANADRRFDQYSTRTYNRYSILKARDAVCGEASRIGARVKDTPAGQLELEVLAWLAAIEDRLDNGDASPPPVSVASPAPQAPPPPSVPMAMPEPVSVDH